MSVLQAAKTICSQAERLGCDVDVEVAATGTHYLTLTHDALGDDSLDDDRVIRVSNHKANEARYVFRINRRPDLDIEPGYQAAAVEQICEWLGIDGSTVPYLKAAATRHLAKATAAASRQATADRSAAEHQRFCGIVRERLSDEVAETFRIYAMKHGRQRKTFRRSPRYKTACCEWTRMYEIAKQSNPKTRSETMETPTTRRERAWNHFLRLAQAGKQPAASAGEHQARRLAECVVKNAPGLDAKAIDGLCDFIRCTVAEPDKARELIE